MEVALTGTPGTGKTSTAELLERRHGFEVVDLKQFARENGLGDQDRQEFEVDVPALEEALERTGGNRFLEGHFAHRLDADVCVVLRCEPGELEQRLDSRGYGEQKVEENLEAEAMDLVLQEAAQNFEKIIEVDTTGRTPEETAEEVARRLEKRDYGYGDLDFSDWL